MQISSSRKKAILAVCCFSVLIVNIDQTIVNVALPDLKNDLHASISGLQWIIDAYTLMLASFMIISGSVADRFGRKKMFMIGLFIFGTGSLLCALSTDLHVLIYSRAFQGIGGSMLNPIAISIISSTFTDPKQRATAIGIWGANIGIGTAAGPIIGGLLLENYSWHSIFMINVPITLIAIICAHFFIIESKNEKFKKFDIPGQTTILIFMASLVGGIIAGPRTGWGSAVVLGLFTLSAIGLIGFIFFGLRSSHPLINPRFFKNRILSSAVIIAVLGMMVFMGFMFVNTIYLQSVRGLSPLQAGLMTLPMAVATFVFSPVSGKLTNKYGPWVPMMSSALAELIAFILMTQLHISDSIWYQLIPIGLVGVGVGLINTPATNTIVAGLPLSESGVGGGIATTSRQIGSSLGAAIAGSIIAVSVNDLSKSTDSVFMNASQNVWYGGIAVCIIIILIALTLKGLKSQPLDPSVAVGD